MERAEHSTISLGDEIKIRKYDELNSTFHKNNPMESYDIDKYHLQELFYLNREWIKENDELKKQYIELKIDFINQEEKVKKALDLLKQKRENAQRDLENIDVVSYIERINKIEAYTDCIATIEAEMGRK